jgi:hypothetical protein
MLIILKLHYIYILFRKICFKVMFFSLHKSDAVQQGLFHLYKNAIWQDVLRWTHLIYTYFLSTLYLKYEQIFLILSWSLAILVWSDIFKITLAAQHQIYGDWKTLLWNRFSWIKYKYNAAQSLKVLYQESTGYNVHQRNITNTVQSYMYKSLTFIKFL